MGVVGIIGGSGLTRLKNLQINNRRVIRTPFGEASGPLTFGQLGGQEVVFIARHGYGHTIPPHRVNYRANIWALHHVGVTHVIAVAAVGGISAAMRSGVICLPDQLMDYTSGRPSTFFEGGESMVVHIDFSEPYCPRVRERLLQAAGTAGIAVVGGGTYAATQGPRLETTAEIRRIERDGGDVVGMTGAPEAVLAREIGLCYAPLSLVVNSAAGKSAEPITMEAIDAVMHEGMERVRKVLEQAVPLLAICPLCSCGTGVGPEALKRLHGKK
ncbi:S-methyl-5'-thioinosine phosphorylase [Acidithiobacillus ferriphilus]|jgi:methylthioadenosine phosphorylase (EC 2.4.2.28)|uniref:Probable S-methyl-5'-thioinosine phosphorylase n=1 Tax=Acidithiobacillus ferrivorans TaxID=160808 RepID=A0A257TE77_9PROT|nr:S-methyl-5'-thioinosine phosphorylase [Acidithiobacillus ferriphilus]OYV82836.1 MAG: methylthioadenosine phosphorylase [Acidithiobacillus ferrivorans]MBU2784356.1 S-methyl-5'-thioinosine phosphorylase [Acidithiobacillus ferriphilus]MBU2827244.1 S-methyl-5'-thioinosine phosphorylase [Acidithiobacillus ferriphilus]MBU2845876.1 S-methyl-5'-thioinosine phosphorylase [Acidithiobacillus ferriphilus]MEB8475181.1 S-methyl-5'-thioinosine phosphorylase [Acidithiobacillus ferriphilus]